MKDYLIPALGIIVVTIVLVVVNERTESTFVQDYAYFLIVAAMLAGVVLAKFTGNDRNS